MYYHYREIGHVKYGKVGPPPLEVLDPYFSAAYRWLGQFCGFHPQVWLSRSRSWMTGYRTQDLNKAAPGDGILFGFESVQGFPVSYDVWCELINVLGCTTTLEEANQAVLAHLEWRASDPELCQEPLSVSWLETQNVGKVLSAHLFVKHDQVVVPSLNLKVAKRIVCRNERQKKELRHMGFLEDRVEIRGRRH